jgi:hypothetical protein
MLIQCVASCCRSNNTDVHANDTEMSEAPSDCERAMEVMVCVKEPHRARHQQTRASMRLLLLASLVVDALE